MTRRSRSGMRAVAVRAIATVVGLLIAVAGPARAQPPRPVEPSGGLGSTSRLQLALAADVVRAESTALHLGVGASVIVGRYVRLGALVAGGPRLDGDRDGARPLDVRADAFVRFVVDPYVERRWAPYGAAGASVRRTPERRAPLAIGPANERVRPYLLLALGVEGPPTRGWLPAAELGVGGGTRLGVVLRRARADGR